MRSSGKRFNGLKVLTMLVALIGIAAIVLVSVLHLKPSAGSSHAVETVFDLKTIESGQSRVFATPSSQYKIFSYSDAQAEKLKAAISGSSAISRWISIPLSHGRDHQHYSMVSVVCPQDGNILISQPFGPDDEEAFFCQRCTGRYDSLGRGLNRAAQSDLTIPEYEIRDDEQIVITTIMPESIKRPSSQ